MLHVFQKCHFNNKDPNEDVTNSKEFNNKNKKLPVWRNVYLSDGHELGFCSLLLILMANSESSVSGLKSKTSRFLLQAEEEAEAGGGDFIFREYVCIDARVVNDERLNKVRVFMWESWNRWKQRGGFLWLIQISITPKGRRTILRLGFWSSCCWLVLYGCLLSLLKFDRCFKNRTAYWNRTLYRFIGRSGRTGQTGFNNRMISYII